jgi:hypothetical protein
MDLSVLEYVCAPIEIHISGVTYLSCSSECGRALFDIHHRYAISEVQNRLNVVIKPADAASAMTNKALKHIVNGCESHMMLCSQREESLNSILNFSKEILETDATSAGIMRMANLEDRLQEIQRKYNELLKTACESDSKTLQDFLNTQCLCYVQKGCKLHGTV